MRLTTKDQDAIAHLYTEGWEENPYKDDVEKIKKHQAGVDRESGRVRLGGRRGDVFDDDVDNMQDPELDSRFENAKKSKISAILDTAKRAKEGDFNAKVILSILKLSFKDWARDLNLLDDPDVKAAINGEDMPNFYNRGY